MTRTRAGWAMLGSTWFAIVLCGCGGQDDSVSESVPSAPAADTAPATDTAAAPARETAMTESAASQPDAPFKPPFPDNFNYFTPPEFDEAEAAPDASINQRPVRVLGFVQVANGEQAALLNLNGQMQVASAGQTINGVQILNVAEPSVTLQCGGDRWSIGLFDEPRPTSDRSHPIARSGARPSGPGIPRNTSPPGGPALPTVDVPVVEAPELNLPELPEPPPVPKLPEINAPGLKSLSATLGLNLSGSGAAAGSSRK